MIEQHTQPKPREEGRSETARKPQKHVSGVVSLTCPANLQMAHSSNTFTGTQGCVQKSGSDMVSTQAFGTHKTGSTQVAQSSML
jgi:hypothetical protein